MFFLTLIILKKNPPATGSYYYIFLRRQNLDPPGDDFLSKFCVFALKYPIFSVCGGLAHPGSYYSKKNPPAAGSYYFCFFKIRFFSRLLLLSQNPGKILSGAYYSTFEGGYYYIPGSIFLSRMGIFEEQVSLLRQRCRSKLINSRVPARNVHLVVGSNVPPKKLSFFFKKS